MALGGIADKAAVDPRPRNAAKASGGRADGDAASPPFDGVLSDVGADGKAPTTPVTAATADVAATASLDPTARAGLEALIDKLGGAGAKADATAEPSVESLLKRAKGSAGGSDPDAASSTPTAGAMPNAAALLAALAAGASLAHATGGVPSAAVSASAAADRKATRDRATPASRVAVTDVAVTTHLASSAADTKAVTVPDAKASAAAPDDAGQTTSADADAAHLAVSPMTTATNSYGSAGQQGHDPDGSAAGARALSTKDAPDAVAGLDGAAATGGSSPIQKIEAALKSVAAQASAAVPETKAASIAPARTLTLQISPADLGTVDVKMRMAGEGLDIQLTIADQQTLGVVTRERDALTSALQGQHYAVHSLVIQDGGAAAQPGGQHASQGQSSGASSSGADTRSGGQGGGTRGDAPDGGGDRSASSRREAQAARGPSAESGSGALLV